MLTPILIASLAGPGVSAGLPVSVLGRHGFPAAPEVQVWTNRDEVFRRGDKVTLYFRTDVDAYVTVFRVDTDGRVRVLFPGDPWADNYAVGGVRYQVDPRNTGYTFRVDDYPGEGYLFAVATRDPFVYGGFVRNDHWDYRVIGTNGRIAGDPYVAIGGLIDGIVPANYIDYAYDIVPYFVDRRYDYPRFLCYDCHAYASYPYWDPYAHSCFKFRIVIYDDPYYYPARVRPRTHVVYQRPNVLVPRYVFKDRASTDPVVVTVRERPVDDQGRRRIETGQTRRTLPGGVLLPTPRADRAAPADVGVRRPVTPQGLDGVGGAGRATVTPTLERRDPAKAPPEANKADPRRPPTRVEPAKPPEVRRPEPKKPSTPPRASAPERRKPPPPKTTPPKKKNDAPPTRRN
jgi:hypothetical protein